MTAENNYIKELIGCGEIKENQLDELAFITYKDMNIYLGKGQKWELSKSKKTIYVVQYEKEKEIARKGFRISSCLFFNEYYN